MQIQNYQIHNVLNVYRRQLIQGKPHGGNPEGVKGSPPLAVASRDEKSQSIMDKVVARVVTKVTQVDPVTSNKAWPPDALEPTDRCEHPDPMGKMFVFNMIDGNHRRETRALAIDNSQMWLKRLDELAQAKADTEGP